MAKTLHRMLVAVGVLALAASAYAAYLHVRSTFTDHRSLAVFILCSVLCGICFTMAALRPYDLRPWKLVWCSALTAIFCVGGIGIVWLSALKDELTTTVAGTPVTTAADVDAYLGGIPDELMRPSVRIPIGFEVHGIRFETANNVDVNGFVWLRFPPSVPEGARKEPLLPEAVDEPKFKEFFRTKVGQDEVIGWTFSAELRQEFYYTRYPLDTQDVWIRVAPQGVGTMLTPDFMSYPPWKAGEKHGLYDRFVSGKWYPRYTVFSYVPRPYKTSYGLTAYEKRDPGTALFFNVGMSRDAVAPLIEQLVPMLFVAALVFASMFVMSHNRDSYAFSGFSTFAVIGFSSSMLLVVSVNHTSIRDETSAHGMIYVEYFYLALYAAILLIAINSILLIRPCVPRPVAWHDNLLPKLLYWPVLFGILLITTVFVFLGLAERDRGVGLVRPVQQLQGVVVALVGSGGTVQDHSVDEAALALRGEEVAGAEVRGAGLAAEQAVVLARELVAVFGAVEGVARPVLGVDLHIGGDVRVLPDARPEERLAGQDDLVARRRVLKGGGVRRVPVHSPIPGVPHFQLRGLLVHLGDERLDTRAELVGERVGGVRARLHEHGREQLVCGELVARGQEGLALVRVIDEVHRGLWHGDHAVTVRRLHDDQSDHHLGDAADLHLLLGVPLPEDPVLGRVVEVAGRGLDAAGRLGDLDGLSGGLGLGRGHHHGGHGQQDRRGHCHAQLLQHQICLSSYLSGSAAILP